MCFWYESTWRFRSRATSLVRRFAQEGRWLLLQRLTDRLQRHISRSQRHINRLQRALDRAIPSCHSPNFICLCSGSYVLVLRCHRSISLGLRHHPSPTANFFQCCRLLTSTQWKLPIDVATPNIVRRLEVGNWHWRRAHRAPHTHTKPTHP